MIGYTYLERVFFCKGAAMDNVKLVDFHVHSNASDGLFSPLEVVKIMAGAGLAAIGLTDHDTINGLPEAACAADQYGIELLPGVEISAVEDNVDIHILGYYPQKRDHLYEMLEDLQKERFARMEVMVEKLKSYGFRIKPEEVTAEARDAAPGRMHLARLMLKKKYVHSLNQAFSLYLQRNRPAFVPRRTFTIKQAMGLLAEAEAIPVIAHPGYIGKQVIERLLVMGLKGIEVFHPDHSPSLIKHYQEVAKEHALIITGGSDFHGDSNNKTNYSRCQAIPICYLQQMKKLIPQ